VFPREGCRPRTRNRLSAGSVTWRPKSSSPSEGSHPIKALIKFLLFIGAVGVLVSYVNGRKLEWVGLTESEARRKFEDKLGPKVGQERAAEVADQVIPRLKERGVFLDDPIAEAVDEIVDELHHSDRATDGD
jgi:hypothetical protein